MKKRIAVTLAALIISMAKENISDAGIVPGYGQSDTYRVTAYCPCVKCCNKTDGITATGTRAQEGRTIAVDPDVIPYGSTVLIYSEHELVGIYIAEDCGGAIKGKRIDIFYDSHSAAREWGVRECQVYVIDAKG